MKSMPIRSRLTIWYCVIFGLLLVIITTTIYLIHRSASYKDIDKTLFSVSFHVQEELESQIQKGKSLSVAKYTSDSLTMGNVLIDITDPSGKVISTNFPSDQFMHYFNTSQTEISYTVQDPSYGRIRMFIRPIRLQNQIVGLICSGMSLREVDTTLFQFGLFVAGITIIGLFLAALSGWFLAKKSLERVELISQTARAIAASQGFNQRVLHSGPKDELGELTDTFNAMLESLEKAYMSQKRFIADASHELRAPLTTIRGNLDILQKMKNIAQEEKDEIIQDLRNVAIRMSRLVADLLALARADAGQDIQMEMVDLKKVLEEVKIEIQSWPTKQRVEFTLDQEVKTWGNRDLLKQLAVILVDNAIKYTPQGGTITITAHGEGGNSIFSVRDQGIGIQKEELPFIFHRFYRSEGARIQSPEGTGLGLSIAKWIVEQHEGSIIVTSDPGEGTEFQVRLLGIK